jgi:hypothetical protein
MGVNIGSIFNTEYDDDENQEVVENIEEND